MNEPHRGASAAMAVVNFLAWTFLFGVIYAQSPLFTSNQNQYFLHGLARAGYGYLQGDWLANTLDPTPVFSALVQYTYQIFQSEWPYYVYYALLMGVYLFSLAGIGDCLFGIRDSRHKTLIYFALLLVIHSAAVRFALSTLLGPGWSFVLEGGVANQRVLGAVLQPSTFGVLLIASVYLFLSEKIWPALLLLAVSVAFHPTYLLAAAMLTLGYIFVLYRETGSLRIPTTAGLMTLSLVSPMVFYVFTSFAATPAEISRRSREILVEFRIPHHAVVADWFDWTTVVQIGLLIIGLILMRRSRLLAIVLICTGLAVGLTCTQILTGNQTLALLFPWRISVILIPIAVATIAAWLVNALFKPFPQIGRVFERFISVVSFAVISVVIVIGAVRFTLELERQRTVPERALYKRIESAKSSGDVYLTPIKLQDFRLETGAPVYVDFKSIPYQAEEVLEWYRRVQLATEFYENPSPNCRKIQNFATAEGISHIVLPQEMAAANCEAVSLIIQDDHYRAYQLIVR